MSKYTIDNALRVAKRYKNAKRSWLLVNPLQAKHIPVSPTVSLEMMQTLGRQLAEAYPKANLVVGFAETATAIGAAVAACQSKDCVYIHTTREPLSWPKHMICFQEEHSHAVEQMLYGDKLEAWLEDTDTVLLVEDEISTGKTMINMVKQLKQQYPALTEKKIVAASILNRVSEENMQLLAENGIEVVWLVKLPEADYTAAVEGITVTEAPEAAHIEGASADVGEGAFANPRLGTMAVGYDRSLERFAGHMCKIYDSVLAGAERVLVLGTEECMYPALKLGQLIEQRYAGVTVRTHATTRSPIGVTDAEGYPIYNGRKLKSLYDEARTTYLYNLDKYDAVLIVTDGTKIEGAGMDSLVAALSEFGNEKIYVIAGGGYDWDI